MRHLITALVGAVALVTAPQIASAADLQARRPVQQPSFMAPVSVFNWTGLYLGIHGGYGWGTADANELRASIDTDGWFGGGQIGYNWQGAGSPLVLGVEVDGAFASIDGSVTAVAGVLTAKAASEINAFGTARLRAGYAWDRWLVYGTGGVAWANNEVTLSASVPGFAASASDDQTHVGWTVGGGLEWAFAPQWSAKVEYLYLALGDETYFGNVAGGFRGDLDIHTVKFGLNYRFGAF